MELTCQQIRNIVKTKGTLLDTGSVEHNGMVVNHLNKLRDKYIAKIGLPTYLSQMLLDKIAVLPVRHCTLVWEDGRRADNGIFRGEGNRPIQKYIKTHYARNLPYKVEVELGVGHIEIRYL